MPPKKKASEPSKKTEAKKKEKIIEDKTFGLKNKRGNKQQKFIKMVNQQVTCGGNKTAREMEKLKLEKESAKDKKKREQDELNALFKPVMEQKVAKGVDPKSVLCAFFKSGKCTKGDKCKFSHDLTIARKSEKRSVYDDGKKKDTMDEWTEEQLAEVVEQKHGETNKALPKTSIICKHFLEAVENSKYGWFWACPGGESCHYRHALPPGFILKKDKKMLDDIKKENEISLEELIEKERAALSSKNLTKVTLESFLKWKEKKKKEKIAKLKANKDQKKKDYTSGRAFGVSGREMFEFNPDLVAGDDADEDAAVFVIKHESDDEGEEGEERGPVRDINLDMFETAAEEVDGSGTIAQEERLKAPVQNGIDADGEENKMDMAGALPESETNAAIAAAMAATVDGVTNGDVIAEDTPIDENLFDGEDLDLVDEELETLDLDD